MFRQLDKELRFGYQVNGSLVVAFSDADLSHLETLKARGETNGVQNLRILTKSELFAKEPHVNPMAVGALFSPDAGNVIPYEFAIALAENAVDNGVELRLRREVTSITKSPSGRWAVAVRCWEPAGYVESESYVPFGGGKEREASKFGSFLFAFAFPLFAAYVPATQMEVVLSFHTGLDAVHVYLAFGTLALFSLFAAAVTLSARSYTPTVDLLKLYNAASKPVGEGKNAKVTVEAMKTGGTGSREAMRGVTVGCETITAAYVINCAGSNSDKVANMIGDESFKIKPRLGDYILLNRNQGHLVSSTLFPCPSKLGKGVLCQTTLWGNLILGPTARDYDNPDHMNQSDKEVEEEILEKCKVRTTATPTNQRKPHPSPSPSPNDL